MKQAMLFKTILDELDKPPFLQLSEDDIYNRIQKEIPEEYKDLSSEEKAELIAFRYPATYSNEFPSLSMITPEMIKYWINRSENAHHPVLVARYSGLVHEYCKTITSEKPHHTITKKHISALLSIIEQDLYKVPVYAREKVKRAFKIALSMNDKSAITRCKDAIIALENKIAINDKPGLWGFSYDLLIEGSKSILIQSEEQSIIDKLELRLNDLIQVDSWGAECAAERLARYYHKVGKIDEVRRVLKNLETSYEKATQGVAVIQQVHYVEKLYRFYKQFFLNEEAEALLKKLRELSKEADKEMKSISAGIDVPKEKIDEYVQQILKGDNTEHIFFRIVIANTPKIKEAKEELEYISKIAPLPFLMSKNLLDKKGRKVATIGPLVEDPESHLVVQFSNTIRIGTIFLHFTFEEGAKQELFSTYEIMKFLRNSCIIEHDRFTVIQRGIEAYFKQEYLTAIHLIIPQFEEAIRNLVEMNGGSILVERDGIFNLKTFDHLLGDEIIKEVFGEDMALYFRVLFTDKRGWNLRNSVAHGLLDTSHFNKQNTDRVLHALLCLGMIRLVDKENKETLT